MRLEKHNADEMTPLERIYAYEHGLSYDRIPSVPFIGNVRCKVGGMIDWKNIGICRKYGKVVN
ncbi:MAG: hypothetical protein ACLTKE_05985 [Coprococcus sp.]